MTYIPDMTPCSYFPIGESGNLIAVGWLEEENSFPTGKVPEAFYRRLEALLRNPWQPFVAAGVHQCSLCQFDGEFGGANVFVPFEGRIFIAPSLILHYVNCHRYQPPQDFIDAVLRCPDMRSMDYKRKLLANGGRDLVKGISQQSSALF